MSWCHKGTGVGGAAAAAALIRRMLCCVRSEKHSLLVTVISSCPRHPLEIEAVAQGRQPMRVELFAHDKAPPGNARFLSCQAVPLWELLSLLSSFLKSWQFFSLSVSLSVCLFLSFLFFLFFILTFHFIVLSFFCFHFVSSLWASRFFSRSCLTRNPPILADTRIVP